MKSNYSNYIISKLLICFLILNGCSFHLFAQTDTLTLGNGTFGSFGCNGIIYDTGGPNGNYTNNSNGIVFLQPTGANFVSITFNAIELEFDFDFLIVYDGPDTNSPELLVSGYGQSLVGETFTSSGPTMTIQFISDYSVTAAGFEIEFSCILLDQAPEPGFTYENICGGQAQFNDETTNFPDTWLWEFGDGTTSDEQNPTHAYINGGSYEVTLTTSNAIGSNSITQFISIPEDEVVEFYLPQSALVNQPVNFSYNNVNINNLVWDLGDGFLNYNDSLVYAYQEPGNYLITIEYLTSDNCAVSLQQNIEVLQTVNIEEANEVGIKIYPNPVINSVNVNLDNINEPLSNLRIYNNNGQLLIEKAILNKQIDIDFSDFEKGAYIIFIEGESATYQSRILKQ